MTLQKSSHSADVLGMMYRQLLAGQFLSLKIVKRSSLKIDKNDLVY